MLPSSSSYPIKKKEGPGRGNPAPLSRKECAGEVLSEGSGVVIQGELVGMRPQCHRIHFVLALVRNVHVDQVLGEHATLEEELVVDFECVEHLGQRPRKVLDPCLLLALELVKVGL